MNIVTETAGLVLAFVGLIEILALWALRPGRLPAGVPLTVVVRLESAESAEVVLRAVLAHIHRLDFGASYRVLCVNESGNSEIDRICGLLARKYPQLELCKSGEMVYNRE